MKKKLISIVTPTFNEVENIEELCHRIKGVMQEFSAKYDYEHIIIDNCSTDGTVSIAEELSKSDKKIKIIVNARNFGPVRSPYYGVINAHGDAVVLLAADLQDPPELLSAYLKKWEEGFDVVLAAKPKSEELAIMRGVRKTFYRLLNFISDVPLENNATGAGLFDKKVINCLRKIADPYPYFRGLICDLGFSRCTIDFVQPARRRGYSKASLYGMFDQAFLAMTKHSKVPLRLMTLLGIFFGVMALLLALIFLILKLVYWNSFSLGIAPLLIAFFFFAAIQFFFLGILGEYVGAILTHIRGMPLVIEEKRINFSDNLSEK
jgi:glycosyltransferase involved in cell wall biosynthesis